MMNSAFLLEEQRIVTKDERYDRIIDQIMLLKPHKLNSPSHDLSASGSRQVKLLVDPHHAC